MRSARESKSRNPIPPPKWPPPAARRSSGDGPRPAKGDAARRVSVRGQDAMAEPKYRRAVVKISGEYLAGNQAFGIHQRTVDRVAGELVAARELGVELGIVVGGGNIFRGVEV